MISIEMLAAFVAVAAHSSVSAAAAELGVGKSLVSKRIAQLEAAVGATLFSRSTRRIALTPAGEAYLEHARRALDEVARGDERLRGLRTELTGRIRLTAPVSWGQCVLGRRLPAFLQQHPSVEIDLLLDDWLMDLAYERFDIGLRWSAAVTSDRAAVPVARVAWLLLASPRYLAARGTPRSPAELAGHACIGYWRDPADDTWLLVARSQREPVRIAARYHVNDVRAVADAALAGLGVALLPDYLCEAEIADGRLMPVLGGWTPLTRFGTRICATGAPERMNFARNRALVAYLREQLWDELPDGEDGSAPAHPAPVGIGASPA